MTCPLLFLMCSKQHSDMKKVEVEKKAKESSLATIPTDSTPESSLEVHRVDRERNLFLAKSYVGEVITEDLREIIRESAMKIMRENTIVEELQDRIRNYEDHIQCLEQLVRELQLMLRKTLEKENSVQSGDSQGSADDNAKVIESNRMQALKQWFTRPIEETKLAVNVTPTVTEGFPLTQKHLQKKDKMMFHKTSHGTHSSAGGEGVLDDFM